MSPNTFGDPATLGTFTGLAIFVILAFIQGWVVSGKAYNDQKMQMDALQQDRDDWKEIAMLNAKSAESVVRVSEATRRSRTKKITDPL